MNRPISLKILLLFFVQICITSCDKDDVMNDHRYPPGVSIQDTTSINDCSLPSCSSDRIVRLIANDAEGKLYEYDSIYFINYPASFDSYIQFILCDLPEEFQVETSSGIDIKYSGHLVDACGVREAVWPIEELFYLKLIEIERR